MKNILLLFIIIFSINAFSETKISELDSVNASDVTTSDVVPIVNYPSIQTKKFVISNLFSIPSLAAPTFTGVVSISNGSSTAPSLALSSDSTTGLYRSSTGVLGISGGLTVNGVLSGKGTTLADSASSGYIGEYLSGSSSNTAFNTTGTWQEAASVTLTPGDWDVTGVVMTVIGTASSFTASGMNIISTSASTGGTLGDNRIEMAPGTALVNGSGSIPSYRVNIASTTTYYLNVVGNFSGGTPRFYARLSARRVR